MNLISRITLIFAIASLLVFTGGGIITYRVMEREITLEQQRFLLERLKEAERYIKRRMPEQRVTRTKMIIEPVAPETPLIEAIFSDTTVTHVTLDRLEPHLKVERVAEIKGKRFRIILFDIIVESDDIVDGVVESLLIIYSILLITVIIIGFFAAYITFKPFRNTLQFIKSFSLNNKETQVKLADTTLPEFKKLNQFLTQMTSQVLKEYHSLKEFSENASHELKTPLAIIQGKLDQLIDEESMSESQLQHLTTIQQTVSRLSKLSDSMVLLTKIDNNEFSRQTDVNVSKVVMQLISDFSELITLKEIELTKSIQDQVIIKSDQTLIEVMISNLLINAIKYNKEGGSIKVTLNEHHLIFQNTGEPLTLPPESLFSRFKKSNSISQSLGLGLSIVKKICDFSGFSVEYLNNSKHHTISVSWATV